MNEFSRCESKQAESSRVRGDAESGGYAHSGGGTVGSSDVPKARSEIVRASQVDGEASNVKSTCTLMSVGTAASQFMEWPPHLCACHAMTVRSGCVFFVAEQQE
jgi:hypothetical protein